MAFVFGESELVLRQTEAMHGNMRFLVELFKLSLVKGSVIKTCLEDLFQELNDQNIEVLCNMLETLTQHKVDSSREDRQQETAKLKNTKQKAKENKADNHSRKQSSHGQELIDLEYLDQCLQGMFKERQNRKIESRVRFKIQDLIEHYEKDWKHEIYFMRRNSIDTEGF